MVWLTQELEWGQDSMSENVKQNNFTQEDFQFVQINEKIFDNKSSATLIGRAIRKIKNKYPEFVTIDKTTNGRNKKRNNFNT